MMSDRRYPDPMRSPENQPFWDAANEGRFIVQQCRGCGAFQFPYRGFCCHCCLKSIRMYLRQWKIPENKF